ncbi:MAG: ABC transporter ATP-binding protein [Tissierellia bacterium]|nr:ABC transporter ATP-binding protein [Tissierellia bacterium]
MNKKEKNNTIKAVVNKFASGKKYLYYLTFLMSAISGITQIIPFYFLYKLIREIVFSDGGLDKSLLINYVLMIFVSQIAGVICNFVALLASHILAFRVEKNMRKEGVRQLVKLPIGFFQNEDTGRLRRIIDDNASKTHTFLAHNFPDITSAFIIPILLIALIIVVDFRLGLVSILGIILSFFFMGKIMNSDMKEKMAEYGKAGEDLNINGVEYIRGIPIVKVFNQSVESFQKFYHAIMNYDEKARDLVFKFKKPMLLNSVSLNAPVILLGPICLLILRGDQNPRELIVKCAFYIMISFLLLNAFMKVSAINESKRKFEISVEKLYEILNLKPMEIIETESIDKAGIFFNNVSFTYPGRETRAVDSVDFHFKHGRNYALVGGSGSGKSTLIKLIARLYDVDEGEIYIEGMDVRSYETEKLLSEMAIVFQETSLLKGSLKDNITMGGNYSDEQIMKAIDDAQCRDILERMDGDWNTLIGTKGTFVSGGEAQRIALARAFLKDSKILLLDEASAYADTENEALIRDSIEKLKKDKLTISIAHRINSIIGADEIIVLDRGRIIDSGTHEELLERNEEYKKLFSEYESSIEWKIDTGGRDA